MKGPPKGQPSGPAQPVTVCHYSCSQKRGNRRGLSFLSAAVSHREKGWRIPSPSMNVQRTLAILI